MTGAQSVKVVGLTFRPGYPATLLAVADAVEASRVEAIKSASSFDDLDETPVMPAVLLVRNPDNEYDANAIEVHVPLLGRHGFVGHVPKDLAARWAPRIDGGSTATAAVSAVLVDPEHLDKPGLEILVTFDNERQATRGD